MSECEPTEPRRSSGEAESVSRRHTVHPLFATSASPAGASGHALQPVTFNRLELGQILDLYGRKVAEGEWRDYAIDFGKERAVFSIFRRSSEMPLYRIEKDPRLARKQGAYSVVTATGLILKRGQELAKVLAILDRRLKLVVS
jgi:hypothetical protein